jgi:hypothetical protein
MNIVQISLEQQYCDYSALCWEYDIAEQSIPTTCNEDKELLGDSSMNTL